MSNVAFISDRGQPKAQNASNVPRVLDDTVTPTERTTANPVIRLDTALRGEFWDDARKMGLALIIGAMLMHLIEKGLF